MTDVEIMSLAEAYLERGRYRRTFGLKGAADDVAAARKLAPEDSEVLMEAVALVPPRPDDVLAAQHERDHGLHQPRHPA